MVQLPKEIMEWFKKWSVKIRRSSAYYPQSNGRAEAGVKSMKRLLSGNVGSKGSIHTDRVAEALLQYRNTPLRGNKRSPAQLALGREIRDTIPLQQTRYKINAGWHHDLRERERCMSKTNDEMIKKSCNNKVLRELVSGDEVLCQNERTKKWDRSGIVVEQKGFRQYVIKIDGSGRISLRNRKHLQKVVHGNEPTVQVPINNNQDIVQDQEEPSTSNTPNRTPVREHVVTRQEIGEDLDSDQSNQPSDPKGVRDHYPQPHVLRRSVRSTRNAKLLRFADQYDKYYLKK